MRYRQQNSAVRPGRLIERLRAGEPLLSLGIRYSRTSDIVRMASASGYDVVWIDLEHSSIAIDAASQIAASAHDIGLGAWVRVPERDHGVIGRLLDSGATGIIGPKIETGEEAALLAAACRFPPHGQRSMIARLPQSGFARMPVEAFVEKANADVAVQALIESTKGVENADAIAATQGVDILAVGTNDLTADMGCPGQVKDPAVMDACATVAAAAKRHGKVAIIGGVADSDHFMALQALGFAPFIFAGIDTDVMADGLAERADAWRGKFG